MNDQELLTYAAKAIDLKWLSYHHSKGLCCRDDKYGGLIEYYWNPLFNDADAFQLMVKLNMFDTLRLIELRLEETRKDPTIDDCQILRRSIVRAAAEIGKGM